LAQNAGQFVIPILCLTLSITAYVSRQVESSVNEENPKRYILQTKAKGLGDHSIIWKHLFRNSSFPLITLISGILPASISGSLVLEVICNIPGMGRLLVDAIFGQDWSVVILVVFISSFLTIIGLLLSDILYRIADPRLQTEV
jgi:peptide/nickel transport system permease protein